MSGTAARRASRLNARAAGFGPCIAVHSARAFHSMERAG
ncbi:hypothetical protein C7S16_6498 [Burkholderia thailandensis]|uniref:Uncharacterized protein n=1 Tax=Burkholderia thailandensis TaxID=57975 RepID=A0AAW9CX52_BURTH|nr:hypothetical protein [Burkholderia thailandensis]MDW9252354.1 hypothetical protein [Burkholderia thailandensis]